MCVGCDEYWSQPTHIDEQLLANALMQAIPMITQLRWLEIMWGELYDDSDIHETDAYEAKPTMVLSVFALVLRALDAGSPESARIACGCVH
jgi:hypothetical protein